MALILPPFSGYFQGGQHLKKYQVRTIDGVVLFFKKEGVDFDKSIKIKRKIV